MTISGNCFVYISSIQLYVIWALYIYIAPCQYHFILFYSNHARIQRGILNLNPPPRPCMTMNIALFFLNLTDMKATNIYGHFNRIEGMICHKMLCELCVFLRLIFFKHGGRCKNLIQTWLEPAVNMLGTTMSSGMCYEHTRILVWPCREPNGRSKGVVTTQ